MTIIDAKFAPDVEPKDFVTTGEDGLLVTARFGDMVIGMAFLCIINKKMMLQDCWSFKLEGTWIYDSDKNIERFYKDKFTPTNKCRRINFEEIGCVCGLTINNLIELIKGYKNDDKYKVYMNDDGEMSIMWIDEWED
jgi:hypothetical protein